MEDSTASASFVRDLRRALDHLYDPVELGNSALTTLFGVDQREDTVLALRRILIGAIESLKPNADVPLQSNAWRLYHILLNRYVEQYTQRGVSTDLGLSIRQLRRQEKLALKVLADHLWSKHDLGRKMPDRDAVLTRSSDELPPPGAATPSREEELEWSQKSLPSESAEVKEIILSALKTAEPLIKALGVRVKWTIPERLPYLAVQLVTLRQALLNVLTTTVRCVPGGRIEVRAEIHNQAVCICVSPKRGGIVPTPSHGEDTEGLEIARELVEFSGGHLDIVPGQGMGEPFGVKITFPMKEEVTVLAIDDNPDTLQLLQRYTSGTCYNLIGVNEASKVLPLAEELVPRAIVLDVMLPEVDGWELLGRLREHPRTRVIPIIVCTILPQKQLALALGAAAFIRKPVSRKVFLAVLDRQTNMLR